MHIMINQILFLFFSVKKIVITLIVLLIAFGSTYSQQTGKIDYPSLGVSFVIPDGWTGTETDELYVLTTEFRSGMVIIIPHSEKLSLQQMMDEVNSSGLVFDYSNKLMPTSDLGKIGENAIGGTFEGTLQYQQVKAYVIGLANPKGMGLTIIATDNVSKYNNEAFQSLAMDLKKSVAFYQPKQVVSNTSNSSSTSSGSIEDWKYQLAGTRLTYMNTYNSGGMDGGGFSDETQIHLCKAGYFHYYDNSSMSFGGDGISAYSSSTQDGDGSWEIRKEGGLPYLILKFNDGNSKYFQLAWEDSKLMLDGYRYFRTWEGEYAPKCD